MEWKVPCAIPGCGVVMCADCLRSRHNEDILIAHAVVTGGDPDAIIRFETPNLVWACPAHRGCCNCSGKCAREANRKPSNQMAAEAAAKGMTCNAYLRSALRWALPCDKLDWQGGGEQQPWLWQWTEAQLAWVLRAPIPTVTARDRPILTSAQATSTAARMLADAKACHAALPAEIKARLPSYINMSLTKATAAAAWEDYVSGLDLSGIESLYGLSSSSSSSTSASGGSSSSSSSAACLSYSSSSSSSASSSASSSSSSAAASTFASVATAAAAADGDDVIVADEHHATSSSSSSASAAAAAAAAGGKKRQREEAEAPAQGRSCSAGGMYLSDISDISDVEEEAEDSDAATIIATGYQFYSSSSASAAGGGSSSSKRSKASSAGRAGASSSGSSYAPLVTPPRPAGMSASSSAGGR